MKIQASCEIAAPRAEVFEAFADLTNLANTVKAITQVELLTEGPIGVGTRFKETRVMFGKEASEIMEITQFKPHELHLNLDFCRRSGCHDGLHEKGISY